MCYALCRFISETKKESGADFPPKTLRHIILAIQMYLESLGFMWKLVDGVEFVNLKLCLDNVMKEKAAMGLGRVVKQAEAFNFSDIEKLWNLGLLGQSNPTQLMETVLFLLGLVYGLRTGREYKMLRRPGCDGQFTYCSDDSYECIKFVEDVSMKTNRGGLKHVNVAPKVVMIYPAKNLERCPVRLFKKYVDLLPSTHNFRELYLQANCRSKILKTGEWYRDHPVGINTLSAVVKKLAKQAGLEGYFTYHSLCHTCASLLHNDVENIPEQVIAEKTGHRSLTICRYKHTKKELKRKVSSILTDGPSSATTSGELSSSQKKYNVPLFTNSELKARQRDGSLLGDSADVGSNVKRVKVDIALSLKE